MSKQSSRGFVPAVADGLDDHLAQFLATLASAGYAEKTQHDKRRVIVPFVRWARKAQLLVADLDEAALSAFLARRPRRGKHGNPDRAAMEQFLEHLRAIGVTPPRRPFKLSAADLLVGRYLDHLRSSRGLCARSIEVYSPFVRSFVAAQRLPGRCVALDASGIRGYLLQRSQNRSVPFVKLLAAALRSFLRFLFLDGGTVADLSIVVPPIRRWRLAALPPFLTPDEALREGGAVVLRKIGGCHKAERNAHAPCGSLLSCPDGPSPRRDARHPRREVDGPALDQRPTGSKRSRLIDHALIRASAIVRPACAAIHVRAELPVPCTVIGSAWGRSRSSSWHRAALNRLGREIQ